MQNIRVIVAVVVVLLAFTGFQLIANYALRRAVRGDVQKQIEQAQGLETDLAKAHDELRRIGKTAAMLREQLATSAEAVRTKIEASARQAETLAPAVTTIDTGVKELSAKLAKCAEDAGTLSTRLKDLSENVDAVEKKLTAAKKTAESVKSARAELTKLKKTADDAATRSRESSIEVRTLIVAIRKLEKDLAAHRKAAPSADDLAALSAKTQQLAGRVTKIADNLKTLQQGASP
jgi:chromosome segregation ATPase